MTAAPPPKSPTNTHGWTPERRAKQSAAIRKWSPWTKSTGPKSADGKACVARNAVKERSELERKVKLALAVHGFYLSEINKLLREKKKIGQNKLLARRIKYREKMLIKRGMAATAQLGKLFEPEICKNLAFRPPVPIKVNAK